MAVQTPVTDQEAILVRYVHPDTPVSSSMLASIICLKKKKQQQKQDK
jgi:hypothetical protein